jgi:hypothetical protein
MLEKPLVIRFTLSKAGVITDSKTGLQWVPANGQAMNHYQAEGYVKNLNLDGGGWRLPTIAELSQLHPLDSLFNATDSNWAWSSELCNNYGSAGARNFYFSNGYGSCTTRGYSTGDPRVLASEIELAF